jgi:hypothetical protein
MVYEHPEGGPAANSIDLIDSVVLRAVKKWEKKRKTTTV